MQLYFGIVGFLCCALGVMLSVRRIGTQLRGDTAVGTVLRMERRESDDGISHFPVISFRDISGVEYTFTSTSGGTPEAFPTGSQVPILYTRSNPAKAYIASWRHIWGAPITCFFVSAAGIWASMH